MRVRRISADASPAFAGAGSSRRPRCGLLRMRIFFNALGLNAIGLNAIGINAIRRYPTPRSTRQGSCRSGQPQCGRAGRSSRAGRLVRFVLPGDRVAAVRSSRAAAPLGRRRAVAGGANGPMSPRGVALRGSAATAARCRATGPLPQAGRISPKFNHIYASLPNL